jgi:bifunctional non-homologous end joining protein LigD
MEYVFSPESKFPHSELMPLAFLRAPFNHQEWIFELKYDGFRAVAYIEAGQCRLVSRRGTAYKSFPQLCAAIRGAIPAASST